jgi:hypothetical protein
MPLLSSLHEKSLPVTDLTDAEWTYLKDHLPTPKAPGRPRVHTLREILKAIFYIVRSGCAWRLLAYDFPTLGAPSTTTSELGGWMERGKGCTPLCASECEFVTRETLSLAQGEWIASRSRQPA